jgi:dUTP pyrophosphatase
MIENNNNYDPQTWAQIKGLMEKLVGDTEIDFSDDDMGSLEDLLDIDLEQLALDMDIEYKTQKVSFEKCHTDAVAPSYVYPSDSGFDLYSVEKVVIEPFGRAAVPTGLKFEFNENLEIQVRPKSGLALNMGLTVLNTPGTVDQGYTGEIKVIVFNTNKSNVIIEKGMKIAQAVLAPVFNGRYVRFNQVDKVHDKDRGDNGFGSTGITI